MTNIIKSDLFSAHVDVIGHGCNNLGMMGAGIAVAFRNRYPDMYLVYNKLCKDTDTRGTTMLWNPGSKPFVANIFTQDGMKFNYDYAKSAFQDLKILMIERRLQSLAVPAIGCGLANPGDMSVEKLAELLNLVFAKDNIDTFIHVL